MASNRNLLVLPGDGIGPEVMNEVRKIIKWMGDKRAVGFDIKEDLVGGAALDKHGVPLSDDTMKIALEADAVLFGSVGGPKWDTADFSKKPERGLLRLRKEMDLFANLRPAKVFDALVDASHAEARDRRGPRHHDHPRADRRRLFRRAARPSRPLPDGEVAASTPSATQQRDPPRLRASPSSWRASAGTR